MMITVRSQTRESDFLKFSNWFWNVRFICHHLFLVLSLCQRKSMIEQSKMYLILCKQNEISVLPAWDCQFYNHPQNSWSEFYQIHNSILKFQVTSLLCLPFCFFFSNLETSDVLREFYPWSTFDFHQFMQNFKVNSFLSCVSHNVQIEETSGVENPDKLSKLNTQTTTTKALWQVSVDTTQRRLCFASYEVSSDSKRIDFVSFLQSCLKGQSTFFLTTNDIFFVCNFEELFESVQYPFVCTDFIKWTQQCHARISWWSLKRKVNHI